MLLAGRRTHNNIDLFYGFKGVFMGSIMGSQNIMGSDYGSNISGRAGWTAGANSVAPLSRQYVTCCFSRFHYIAKRLLSRTREHFASANFNFLIFLLTSRHFSNRLPNDGVTCVEQPIRVLV
jgi:hypothetical protein